MKINPSTSLRIDTERRIFTTPRRVRPGRREGINLAKSAGFCFGVKRALKIALEAADCGGKVYMLGDIVHNEDVVKQIERAGIKKIKQLGDGRNKSLLIRAHGAPLATFHKAIKNGYKIIDATCPMVKEIHKIVKNMEDKGYRIIIVGDKRHDEVLGILGQLRGKAIVIDKIKNIPFKKIKKIKRAGVASQSTQDTEKVLKIIAALKSRIKDLKFFNTVCQPTRMKQEEIRHLPRENDVMIIIGSKASANTRRLYEISKALNPRSYWITAKKEIQPQWFKGAASVGITAGASTPDSTTQEVVENLKQLSCQIKSPFSREGKKGLKRIAQDLLYG